MVIRAARSSARVRFRVGIIRVRPGLSGGFSRGDTVAILSPEGREIARGLVAYDAADAVRIAGLKTAEIENVLGYEARSAMIHRDDLVVSVAGESGSAFP